MDSLSTPRPASASSSSVNGPSDAEHITVDLRAAGEIPPVPRAFLEGSDLDLLAPLRFAASGRPLSPPQGGKAPDRKALAAAMAVTNRGWGHPRADELATRLADPATRVVVTGQQPGLLGGPLMSLVKMLAATQWAREIERDGQGPVVPVFWVATEDHDWAELSHTRVVDRSGPVDLALGEDPTPLAPMGMRTFGEPLGEILAQLEEIVPGAHERLQPVLAAYRPDARFGEAFCRLHASLLGERAPLFLDAMLPALKEASRPYLRGLVEHRRRWAEELESAEAAVTARGYALQVAPQPGASPLFLLQGGERRRILWEGEEGWQLRGGEGGTRAVGELLEIIEENPAVVTPGVLARPMIQDAVLGTTLQIMGPAETTYLTQAAAAYRALDRPGPWTTLRPRARILEPRQVEHLRELDASLAEVLATSPDDMIHERFGQDLTRGVAEQIQQAFEALRPGVVALDPNLATPVDKTRDHALRGLQKLEGKIKAAEGRRHGTWKDRLLALREMVAPGGKDHERSVGVVHFLLRYGPGFVDRLADELDLDPTVLRATILDPAASTPRSGA